MPSNLPRAALELLFLTSSFILAYLLGFLFTYHLLRLAGDTITSSVLAQSTENCYTGSSQVSKDLVSPFGNILEPEIPQEATVSGVLIKAGDKCFGPYSQNGTFEPDTDGEDACYGIEGFGTDQLSVSRDGEGEGEVCPEISQIEVIWDLDETPTATPSATLTPTGSLAPSPTDTPSSQSGQTSDNSNSTGSTNSSGQVLGASTLASTGSPEKSLLFIGILFLTLSVYGISYKIARSV